MKYFRKKSRTGFTLVETLVALGVLGMFFLAISLITKQVLTNIAESRTRTTALALAQSKMEIIRNLSYANVGTVGGIPSGPIEQQEQVDINNQAFQVQTSIEYVDDPFDDVAPIDTVNTDYKRTRIEVTWGGAYPSRYPVTLVSNVVPRGVETSAGGGTLFIQVFNANIEPVANASIQIDNTSVSPEVHTQTLTNQNGLVVIPGAPACVTCYEITVTKNGYSTDRTYSTSEVTNPLQPHSTVLEGQVTQLSFAIDQNATIFVNAFGTRESGYPPVGNVQFELRGSKLIGYDAADEPVYKYSEAKSTIGNTVGINGLEWDSYTLDFTNSFFDLAGSIPIIPVSLTPGETKTINIVTAPKTTNSFLVIAQNSAQNLLASASATLFDPGQSFISTKSTGLASAYDEGQVFWGGLQPGQYNLKLSLDGYIDATASVNISGITQGTYTLNNN